MILNPWQGTFNRLGLERLWWHRLAVVAFFITLVLVLGASSVAFRPAHSTFNVEYWQDGVALDSEPVTTPLPPPPPGYSASDVVPSAALPDGVIANPDYRPAGATGPPKQRVSMPDGNTVEFSGKAMKSEAEIRRIWNIALLKAWLLSIAIAIGITLAVSYLFQSLYRALLYVVYGSAKNEM